jgi:glycosyltransferase involved in cell wall biosynthesis
LRHIRFVFDIYDDYRCFASARIPGVKTLFWRLVRSADHLIVASAPLAALVGRLAKGVTVVENGIDPALFHSMDKVACREVLQIPAREPVIGFFGSMERRRGADVLLTAFESLRSQYPDLRLLLAGRNSLALPLDQPGVDYRGEVSQSTVAAMINACDVVTLPYERDPQVDVSNACKIAEYLTCGTPIVATRVSNMEAVFRQTPQILAEPGDPDDLAEKLALQLEHPVSSAQPPDLTWSSLARRVEEALLGLTVADGQPP